MSNLADILKQIEAKEQAAWEKYQKSKSTEDLRAVKALQDERSAALERYR